MLDGDIHTDGEQATGRKYISGSEPFVLGHYPGTPIFPGVLSIQLLQETAEAFVKRTRNRECRVGRFSRIQFLDMARPGDVLEVRVAVKKETAEGVLLTGDISASGKAKMRGNLRVDFL